MDRPDTTSVKHVLMQADRDDYEVLKSKRGDGNNCGSCNHSRMTTGDLRCSLKASKRVYKLAICQHFRND